jgi:hypothetical protein
MILFTEYGYIKWKINCNLKHTLPTKEIQMDQIKSPWLFPRVLFNQQLHDYSLSYMAYIHIRWKYMIMCELNICSRKLPINAWRPLFNTYFFESANTASTNALYTSYLPWIISSFFKLYSPNCISFYKTYILMNECEHYIQYEIEVNWKWSYAAKYCYINYN